MLGTLFLLALASVSSGLCCYFVLGVILPRYVRQNKQDLSCVADILRYPSLEAVRNHAQALLDIKRKIFEAAQWIVREAVFTRGKAQLVSSLYRINKKGMDRTAIGVLSIPILYSIYTILLKYPSLSNPFFTYLVFTLPALGTIFGRDFDEPPNIRVLVRSSTDDGDHGASRDHQRDVTKRGLEAQNVQVEDVVSVVEPANTMDRDCLNNFLDDVENDDNLDGLGVMEIDRLTRAPVFEAVDYYREMEERDALLYANSIGFIDWDDLNDINQLLNQTVFARKWYLRIKQGTAGSIISDIEDEKYPVKTPFGFETDSEHNIWVEENERQFMYRTFQTYLREENRAEVARQMNEWRQRHGKQELSSSQYKTLLTSPLVKGHLTYKEQLIKVVPRLRVVDDDTFRKAQEIRRGREPTQTDRQDLPGFIERGGMRYGIDFIISILDSFEARCRKCGGELTPNGKAEVLGVPLQSYTCLDCNHQGPLLKEAEIQELHHNNPLRCPLCPATERFDVEKVPGFDEYRYTCQVCEESFKHDTPPDKIERAILYPETKFDMNRPYNHQTNSNSGSTDGDAVSDDGDNRDYMDLTSL